MAYATPAQFISQFGLEETTQLLQDEERLLTAQLLKDAMAGSWTGTPTVDEQAAATNALARLTDKLTSTSNFMDGYLRAVVTLPLADDDANAGTLKDCCLAFTRCGLADDCDNSTERMLDNCSTWRAWLKDVSARRVQLVAPSGATPAGVTGSVRGGQASSGYCWGAFGRNAR